MTEDNLQKLLTVFRNMGYDAPNFPEKVLNKEQNISIKFSPADLDLELITNFSTYLDFNEAYQKAEKVEIKGFKLLRWRVLALEDLVNVKIRSGRIKDLNDILELKRIHDET